MVRGYREGWAWGRSPCLKSETWGTRDGGEGYFAAAYWREQWLAARPQRHGLPAAAVGLRSA